jgi:hypothetical protein
MEVGIMEKKYEVYCSTRRFEGDDAVRTKLTLDFSSLTEQDVIDMAIDSAVIKWQGAIRRKKNEKVPSEATYVVPRPGSRTAPTMSKLDMLYNVFGKEKVIGLINKAGGDVDAVVEKLTALLDEME